MAKGYKHGTSGGAATTENVLNFTVVGGTTEPTAPTENTIWVNTPIDITAYYFSYTQPENMVNGDVWFNTSNDSSVAFNALKDNCIKVCPVSTMQMVNSALVEVNAKIYQNGAWVEWFVYLYNKGNQCTDITGGWKKTIATNGTVTFNSDSIKVSITANSNGNTVVCTGKAIDLTKHNTLNINVIDVYKAGASIIQFIVKPQSIVDASTSTASASLERTGVISLDVSSLSGSYYIGVGGGWFTPCSATFDEVWLT